MRSNVLYYGDNLDVLRRYVPDESVDLVYLDPPFNSNATYNVLFAEQNGTQAAAQIKAFEDTWHWDLEAAREYEETVEAGGGVANALMAFRTLLGESNMLAYLSMMAPRLVELRRVLKPTGSIYLHCDPTASHYLKLLMDAVFEPRNFKNEIIWKRSHGHNLANRYGSNHDTILFYSRTATTTWNQVYQDYDPEYVQKHYRHVDSAGRRYKHENPTGAGISHGKTGEPWRGIDPTAKGRHWARPPAELETLEAKGLIHWPDRPGAWPYIKTYLDDMPGVPAQEIWSDIPPINMMAKERLGYPTQKPEALLERIIQASSDEGDVVLDPFCGCGTSIVAAEKLKRHWIGIDITHLAIALIKNRLHDTFGEGAVPQVIGEPVSIPDAQSLAASDPYQFQWWALGLVGARPVEQKKGTDKGIDGRLLFHDEARGKTKQIILSVKAGHTGVSHIRDLRGVLEDQQAQIGVLISMEDPTRPMREFAASAGFYESPGWGTKHPRMQLLTVAELLDGRSIDYPSRHGNVTFKRAAKAKEEFEQLPFPD